MRFNGNDVITIGVRCALKRDKAGTGNKTNSQGRKVELRFHRPMYVCQHLDENIEMLRNDTTNCKGQEGSTYLEMVEEGRTKPEQLIWSSDTTNDTRERHTNTKMTNRIAFDPAVAMIRQWNSLRVRRALIFRESCPVRVTQLVKEPNFAQSGRDTGKLPHIQQKSRSIQSYSRSHW